MYLIHPNDCSAVPIGGCHDCGMYIDSDPKKIEITHPTRDTTILNFHHLCWTASFEELMEIFKSINVEVRDL